MNSEQIKTDKNGVVKIKPISDEQLIINIDKIKSYDIQNIFSMLFNQVIPKIIKRDEEDGYISEEQAKLFRETYDFNKFESFINNEYNESDRDEEDAYINILRFLKSRIN